jgi:two-component system sensor histidine kinase BaeS
VKRAGDELKIEVIDQGIGMLPEEQRRLFDRFYRGENPLVLKTPGNGLGLAIARQLAELHGGKVWLVASQVGEGSTFAITLPLA